MDFLQPTTWAEALSLRSERPDALPIAGGTDVMVDLNFDRRRPGALMDLGRVAELREWAPEDGHVRLGAAVTYSRVIAELGLRLPGLAMASRTVGSPQIRNRGTVGGNLGAASPAGDAHPPLLAAGTAVTGGPRRISPAAHLAERFAAAEVAGPRAVSLREVPFLTMVGLRTVPGTDAAGRLEVALGTSLPNRCGSVSTSGDGVSVLWLSPDEFLVITEQPPTALATELAEALGAGAVFGAETRLHSVLRVRHEAHHVARGVGDAGNVAARAVRVPANVAEHHTALRLQGIQGLLVRDVLAVLVLQRPRAEPLQ